MTRPNLTRKQQDNVKALTNFFVKMDEDVAERKKISEQSLE
jgi:hypothetical protein